MWRVSVGVYAVLSFGSISGSIDGWKRDIFQPLGVTAGKAIGVVLLIVIALSMVPRMQRRAALERVGFFKLNWGSGPIQKVNGADHSVANISVRKDRVVLADLLRRGRELEAKIETEDYYEHRSAIEEWYRDAVATLPGAGYSQDAERFMHIQADALNDRDRLSERIRYLKKIYGGPPGASRSVEPAVAADDALRGKLERKWSEGKSLQVRLTPAGRILDGGAVLVDARDAYDVWVSRPLDILSGYSSNAANRFRLATGNYTTAAKMIVSTARGQLSIECEAKCAVLRSIIDEMRGL